MTRAYVDANVIVRLITGDPPDMAESAAQLFQRVDEGDLELVLDATVMAEVVWVLSSFYGFSTGEIAPTLSALLSSDGIVCEDKSALRQALELFGSKNIDFVDALVAVRMLKSGVRDVHSFDKHFDRISGVRRVSPH